MGAKAKHGVFFAFGVGSYTSEVNEQPSSITAEFLEQETRIYPVIRNVATEKHESNVVETAPDGAVTKCNRI